MVGPRRLRALALALAASAAATALYWTALKDPYATGFGDYQEYHHIWEAGLVAMRPYGELPLWNPFHCGGIPQLGNPQSQVFHPLFFMVLLLGSTLALKLFLLVHAALGLAGMYLLARKEEGLGRLASVLAAVGWAGSGFFAWHCGTGHANFIAFYLTPWLLLAWRRAAVDLRYCVGVGLVMALTVMAGGVYAFPYFVLLLAFDAAVRLVRPKLDGASRSGIVVAGVASAICAALLAAIRLLPIVEHLGYYPRAPKAKDVATLAEAVIMLTRTGVSSPGTVFGTHKWGWSEYGGYVGWVMVALGALGVVRALVKRQRLSLVVGAVLFGALALGDFGPLAPWHLLHRLPVYDELRVPSRFTVLFLFYFVLLAAIALDSVLRKPPRHAGRWLSPSAAPAWIRPAIGAVLFFAAVISIASHHWATLHGMWQEPRVHARGVTWEPRFYVALGPKPGESAKKYPPQPQLPAANVSTAYCYTGMQYRPASGLWLGPSPQARVRGDGAAVLSWGHSSQTMWANVRAPRGGRVIFNATFAPGWRTSAGRLAVDEGRVAVDVPAGTERVRVDYLPLSFPWALLLTTLGVVASTWILIARRKRPVRPSASAIALLSLALLSAGIVGTYAAVIHHAWDRTPRSSLR